MKHEAPLPMLSNLRLRYKLHHLSRRSNPDRKFIAQLESRLFSDPLHSFSTAWVWRGVFSTLAIVFIFVFSAHLTPALKPQPTVGASPQLATDNICRLMNDVDSLPEEAQAELDSYALVYYQTLESETDSELDDSELEAVIDLEENLL